jgi:hypothetical protein
LITTLMRVIWDSVVDNSPTRHLITIIAFLPSLYLQLCGEKTWYVDGGNNNNSSNNNNNNNNNQNNSGISGSNSGHGNGSEGTRVLEVLSDLTQVVARWSPELAQTFNQIANLWATPHYHQTNTTTTTTTTTSKT